MTQKELLYVEDAVGHEQNIIKICNESTGCLQDEELIKFFEEQIKEHTLLEKKLIKLLEECTNE